MTPSQIETAARNRLNASNDTLWSSSEVIEDCLYFAMIEVARETRCIEDTATSASVASTATYSFPTYAMEIKRVTYDGKVLTLVDQQKLDFRRGDTGTTVTGTPEVYVEWEREIELWPVPATSALTIKFWYYGKPARPTSSSTLEIASEYDDALVAGTCYYMVAKEPGDPRTAFFRSLFDDAIMKCKILTQRKKRAGGFNRVNREEDMQNLQ